MRLADYTRVYARDAKPRTALRSRLVSVNKITSEGPGFELFARTTERGICFAFHLRSVMSFPLSAKPQPATRQLPVARGRDRDVSSEARVRASKTRRSSDSRLQAPVVQREATSDPYADVPCTD